MGEVRQVQFGKRSTAATGSNPSAPVTEGNLETNASNVLELSAFRSRKELSNDRKIGIGEAFSGLSPVATDAGTNVEFSDRIERIKSSISRINQLMSELRSVSKDDNAK